MPEGDTIFRTASRLGGALEGRRVERIEAPRWAGRVPEVGETVDAVEATGKHLRIGFSGGLDLWTHMRMTGSWHLYRRGERWRRSRVSMRVVIATDEWEAVCFSAPDVKFSTRSADGSVRSTPIVHLGPDLCTPDADLDECVRRFSLLERDVTVAEALLDQRVCCGVGNVYKSEVCWAVELDPFTPVGSVPAELRRRLVEVATAQLRANLGHSARVTVPGGLAVYGRAGKRCRRCDGVVEARVHGRHPRRTFWCPGCQLPPGADETSR